LQKDVLTPLQHYSIKLDQTAVVYNKISWLFTMVYQFDTFWP